MKQKKNIVFFLCIMCIFALTGCMKFVFNNSVNGNLNSVSDSNVVNADIFDNSSHVRYDQLNDTQKIVYEGIFNGIQNCQTDITISESIYEDDLEKIYDAIINTTNFELVYPTRKYDFKYDSITGEVYKISPKYEISLGERNTMIENVERVANQIVSKTMGMSDFDTVKFFHDYIILNCSYSSDSKNYSNAYGALIEHNAVCEGYARAFKYLCDKVNIPCELVIGYTNMEHMWNIVQLDGNWYHIDVTWDDPKNKDGDYISYTYFNLTEEQILLDHSINDTYTIPWADSTTMNYFEYYNLYINSIDEFKDILYSQVYNACLNNDKYIHFKAVDSTIYDEVISNLCNDYDLCSIIEEVSNSVGISLDTSNISFSYDDTMLTITINLKYE